jgi:hypothetical protein
MKQYEYDAVIVEDPDSGGAYVAFPWDIRQEFGKGRVKVHATFDGIPYDGSVVNMSVKNADGEICYVIGVVSFSEIESPSLLFRRGSLSLLRKRKSNLIRIQQARCPSRRKDSGGPPVKGRLSW